MRDQPEFIEEVLWAWKSRLVYTTEDIELWTAVDVKKLIAQVGQKHILRRQQELNETLLQSNGDCGNPSASASTKHTSNSPLTLAVTTVPPNHDIFRCWNCAGEKVVPQSETNLRY